jgi:hypothetical protein
MTSEGPRNALGGAQLALALGIAPIPVPIGSKRPVTPGWPHLRIAREDLSQRFAAQSNVGALNGEPSGDLIDVDLDTPEALALADAFLPPTALVFGRASKPRAHRLYRTTDSLPRTRRFSGLDGTMLVELLSTGTQTLWPPSTHPSGEVVEFDECPGEPARVDGTSLAGAVARLAACALLARHWPTEPGSRHDVANAVAGFLLRGGLDDATVVALVEHAAGTSGDEQWKDRGADVRTTARTLVGSRPATGGPMLVTLLGEAVVDRLREFLGLAGVDSSFRSFRSSLVSRSSSISPTPPRPQTPSREAFHGLAGEIVRTIEPHTEADPAALLVQLLVVCGHVIGRGPHFVAEGDRHYTNLFAVLVGDTAKGRKGSSWGQIRRLFDLVGRHGAVDRIRATPGLSTGEGLIHAVRDAAAPSQAATPVGGWRDLGVEDKRLLAYAPEFATVLRRMDRDSNTLSPVLREAWDSGNLAVLTKTSPARATDAHISVIAHITRDELRRYLTTTETGNGFANRFLFVYASRSKLLPEGGQLDDAALVPLAERLKAAIASARQIGGLKRDPEARKLWHAVYPGLSAAKPGLLGAVIARAEAQVMRLACVYALLDSSSAIREPHLRAALAVWDYCEASARHVFGEALGDPVADELLRVLRASPAGLDRTEIRDMFARNRSGQQIGNALGALLEHGLARCESRATGGRPAERWYAVPPGTTETTETTKRNGVRSSMSSMSYLDLAKQAVEPDPSEPTP